MASGVYVPILLTFICVNICILTCSAQVLTPPTFNLAKGRKITATSTCGYDVSEPELFCRLTGATGDEQDNSREIIQGQLCDYCNPADPDSNHSIEFAIDGSENWWQSPPLSRGNEFNAVDIVIDLGQEFHIAYVVIKMANSPRPGVWALEKSADYGETWEPWQYFADTPSDCVQFFNTPTTNRITADNEVMCITEFSRIVPLENGEIFVSLVNDRPNANNYSYADKLHDFMKATNVRLRLKRARTLLGHLMKVARQDSTVTRRYYYSIKDISIGGRCACNGHADTCHYHDPSRPNFLICNCQHNTVGDQCERCDAAGGWVQKKWQPARAYSSFECELCQCYNRASGCVYDPEVDEKRQSIDIHGFYHGGGVCQNCWYNSTGINCEKCLPGYYRPTGVPVTMLNICERCVCDARFHINECEEGTGQCLCRPEYEGYMCDRCAVGYYGYPRCIPCDCDINGTEGNICHVNGGQCPCMDNFVGKKCDMCQLGYFNFPECGACECDMIGSMDDYCDVETGQCSCNLNYGSRNCSQCFNGYFNFPDCTLCNCDPQGSTEEICHKVTGECMCADNYNGGSCDVCARGFYAYPHCTACQCREHGSIHNDCEDRTGQCQCRHNFAGQNCERCAAGYYRYPDCVPCNCDQYGSYGQSCDQELGQCDCYDNFQGLMCDKCREGLYNYPNCEECNCNPAGAREVPGYPLGGCGEVVQGRLCECKERVIGRICDQCMPGYWNLNRNNPLGCAECTCSEAGTVAGMNVCNMITGQCMCKVDVSGRNCDRCKDGFHGLHKTNIYGCQECNCDIGGSKSLVCDKETGQCPCKPRVQGLRCDLPIEQHFIPALDQLKYEVEDGYTPEGAQVRYGYDERLFPGFSWRGYAILITVQPQVLMDIEINKPTLYRLLYRFVNLNDDAVTGEVTFLPDDILQIEQKGDILFSPTSKPAFASVGNNGGLSTFVLNPGRWTVSIKSSDSIFLDYFVLIPQDYYEATVLQTDVHRPCIVPFDEGPCIHYSYPDVLDLPRVLGSDGYIINKDGDKVPVELFTDKEILDGLDIDSMAVLGPEQKSFNLDLEIPEANRYVMIMNYHTDFNGTQTVLFDVNGAQAITLLYNCEYSALCRQVLSGFDEREAVFDFANDTVNITVLGDDDVNLAIESIVAIPYNKWRIGYISPSIVCIRINGVCVGSKYATPVGSVRIDFEEQANDHLRTNIYPPGVDDFNIGMVMMNRSLDMIVLVGVTRGPGPHKFVVHYYLPFDAGTDMPVTLITNGQEYRGIFRPRYCPSIHGCRGLIYFDESGQTNFLLQDPNVQVVFNNTDGQQIWLDYMLLIPSGQYSPQDITLRPVDNSRNFIDTCLTEGFKIKQPVSEFCEDGLFTLTSEFNNGALECDCNIDGSMSFNCDSFGGQCDCRPNVIGRTCSACRVGYFGFPRCQPCNCPFGLCHQVTGDCICPPRVTGARCDVCKPGTYGYDALIGCQECGCSPQGVIDGDMNCHEMTGQCSCLPGIGGRKCDFCLPGFHSFPMCRECDCDRFGTTDQICDASNSQCLCKDNVVGPRCDQCATFTYNLNEDHPAGCTSCYCFGVTANCMESDLYWTTLMDMEGWGVTNTFDHEVRDAGSTIAVLDTLDKIVDTGRSMYWTAPTSYLGDKVASYGGYLHYKVLFVLPRNESLDTHGLLEPDVILQGNNMTIVYRSPVQPQNSQVAPMEVQLLEYKFEHPGSGAFVDRETFMMVLVNLQALHIRASYFTLVEEVRLMDVELDVGASEGPGEFARSVEQCRCTMGYTGSSCEKCEKNYYRPRHFPNLGPCVPCDCNGHAGTCDVDSGVCQTCQNNTMGPHCDKCLPGYYGDPATGPCYICGCPLGIDANNFADSCSVGHGGQVLSCGCHTGYTGERCERCAPGYYGYPMQENETCDMCRCSGNLDMNEPESCDFQSGDCLICSNNSTGPNCERCRDWWYGDAVVEKDCYPCSCNQCGSLSCSQQNGACTCMPNVIGLNCDRCAPDTFGFSQCNGCTPCECSAAVVTSQCNADNGTCFCQPGVTGEKCDSCISGYWNYRDDGCQMCHCMSDGAVTCDPQTGACQCLPGVTGDRCTDCVDRWVLIPNEGCQECESCIHHLLDDTDRLDYNISAVQQGLKTVSIGVYAMRRLDTVNQTAIAELQPLVNAVLYESENVTLDPLEKEFDQVSVIVNNILSRTQAAITSADVLVNDGDSLMNDSYTAEDVAALTEQEAGNAVRYIQEILSQILQGIQVTNIETYISLAEQVLDEINMRNFSAVTDADNDELAETTLLLEKVKELQSVPENQMKAAIGTSADVADANSRLLDLQNGSQISEAISTKALNLVNKLREDVITSIQDHIDELGMAQDVTQSTLTLANGQLDSAKDNIDTSEDEFARLESVSSYMQQAEAAMNQYNMIVRGLDDAASHVNDSFDHAEELESQAQMLDNVYTDTREISTNAVEAASAYDNIVTAIQESHNASETALLAAKSALMKSSGVGEESTNLTASSVDLLLDAQVRYNTTRITLIERLAEATDGTNTIADMNKNVQDEDAKLKAQIDLLPVGVAGGRANDTIMDGEDIAADAETTKARVRDIIDNLPEQMEKTKPLVTDVITANNDINVAKTQVNNVQKFIPNITTLLTDLTAESVKVQEMGQKVTKNIAKLKEKIAIARNQANLIRVGLKFLGNTTVQLANPPNVAQAGSYSKVSLFIKTGQEDALLMYAGSEWSGTNRANQDYMSLELDKGNVVFKYDLGDRNQGPAIIRHTKYVADNKWYKVTGSRIGKAGLLQLEQDPLLGAIEPVAGSAKGLPIVLEMNQVTTKFFAGGLPDDAEGQISDEVSRDKYVGVMEEIKFDDRPMGIWNFRGAENNLVGARERGILTSIVSNGFRFDGSGYVILSTSTTGWKPSVKAQISMKLKTYAENGLIFYAGDGKRDFISLEVRDGYILYQFDLGAGRARLQYPVKVNDGKWHDLQVNRLNRTGVLFLDKRSAGLMDSPGTLSQLSITDNIYIGGYEDIILPVSDITKQGFEGCIVDVTLQLGTWDLNENKKAKGVTPGCPEQIAREATFTDEMLSYVANPIESIGSSLDITFKMKTKQAEALLVYAGHSEKPTGFSVSIVGGRISVVSDPGAEKLVLTSKVNSYNDGRWHYISIMKMGQKWQMNIDDYETVQGEGAGSTTSLDTDTPVYFGNADISISPELAGSTTSLIGCIGDVTINGEFLNFASLRPEMRPGVSLSGCPIPDPEGPYDREVIPTAHPTWEFTTTPTTTAATPPPGKCTLMADTDTPELAGSNTRGIYYGAYPNSKIEYTSLISSLRIRSAFSMQFRTTAEKGVMFYFADNKHVDHISLVMKDGQIRYTFNSGTGPGIITSTDTYNDGKWHTVQVGRSMREGTMQIDDTIIGVTNSEGRARSINGKPPFYFGGIGESDWSQKALSNLDGVTESFRGCIADIKLNDKAIGEPPVQNGTIPCSDITETGAYFYGDGGYIQLVDGFNVGIMMELTVEIRPRSLNGVIFSVHGSKGDFVVLQLVEGELWWSADNGAGSIIAKFTPEMNNKLCDGMWHTVKAVKNKNVVVLEVDDFDAITTTSAGKASSADTNNPVYIGGKPDAITKGVRAAGDYLGCLRNIWINGVMRYTAPAVGFGSVNLQSCPVN